MAWPGPEAVADMRLYDMIVADGPYWAACIVSWYGRIVILVAM